MSNTKLEPFLQAFERPYGQLFSKEGLVPYRESHEGDVSEPLGLLAKHSLLRLSGLYKLSVELHDYGLKPSATEPVANLTAVAVSRAARVERSPT